MTLQQRRRFVGLVTATSELGASEGACRVADNCVLRRQGMLEAREGYPPLTTHGAGGAWDYRASHAYLGETLIESGSSTRTILRASGATLLGPYAAPRVDSFGSVVARGVLLVPTNFGIVRVPALGATAQTVGLAPPPLPTVTLAGATGVVPTLSKVAYRLTLVRTETSGLVVRSRPTPPVAASNVSGTSQTPTVSGTVAAAPTGQTVLEIYRTRAFPNAITLDDEMQLVGTVPVPVGTVSYTFTDATADTARTTTLYTSPSRGGIEGSNLLPPLAAQVGLFRGSVVLGDVKGAQRLTFSHRFVTGLSTTTGVGTRVLTGVSTTAGSFTFSYTGGGTGLELGMVVDDGGPGTPFYGSWPRPYITALGAGTVTMSYTAGATLGSTTLTFRDAIQILPYGFSTGAWYGLGAHGTLRQSSAALLDWPATPVAGWDATYTLEMQDGFVNDFPFSIRATHGDEFNPPLPKAGQAATTAATAARDVQPGYVYWSDPDEPEHYPPRNFALIGDKQKRVLGFGLTRDALFVLKEDGVFRMSGTNGAFRVDPIDLTTRCIAPSSVRALNNRVYALTNKGLCAIDDAGVELVGRQVSAEQRVLIDLIQARMPAEGVYAFPPGQELGQMAAIDERWSEYLVCLPAGLSFGGQVLVLNTEAGTLTTWSIPGQTVTGVGTDALGAPLLFTGLTARSASASRPAVPAFAEALGVRADRVTTTTGFGSTSFVDGSFHFGFFDLLQAVRVGDVILSSTLGLAARIVSIVTLDDVVIDRSLGTDAIAVAIVRPVFVTVEPHGFATPDLTGKLWTEVVMAFSALVGVTRCQAAIHGASALVAQAIQTVRETLPYAETPPGPSGYVAGTLLKLHVPLVHRRAYLLRAALELELALGEMRLEAVAADAREDAQNRTQSHATGTT